jgi:hypothetical protein
LEERVKRVCADGQNSRKGEAPQKGDKKWYIAYKAIEA